MALRRKVLYAIFYWAPPLLWMGFIFFLSSRQKISVTHTYASDFAIFKTLHMIEYAILFFLLFRAAYSLRKSLYNSNLFAMICSILFAASDEIHQLFVATRQGTVRDIFIDTIGIIIMYIVVRKFGKFIKFLL